MNNYDDWDEVTNTGHGIQSQKDRYEILYSPKNSNILIYVRMEDWEEFGRWLDWMEDRNVKVISTRIYERTNHV